MGIVTNSRQNGLVGIVPDDGGNQYKITNEKGFAFLSKEQMDLVKKAMKGDQGAADALKGQGIYLNSVTKEEGAQLRADLKSAGMQKFAGKKKEQDRFVKQMDDLGGNKMTFAQKFRSGLDRNAHGVVTVSGSDKKPWQVTRNDGKSPTKNDILLGEKVAKGDQAAAAQAKSQGLLVTQSKDQAATLLDPVSYTQYQRV